MIKLIKDTINREDIEALKGWLDSAGEGKIPQLTKGPLTEQFEKEWSKWLGVKNSVFVNSGSSANLLMVYAMILSGKLKIGDKVGVSALSWATTVAPLIQLGLKPVLVDVELNSLGVNPASLEQVIRNENIKALMLVHILGIPCEMDEILTLCNRYGVHVLEDSCESIASTHKGKKTGTFGLMSTFSFYIGHFISTIEGGMVSTDNRELYYILKSIRSNGWDRELPVMEQTRLREYWKIDDFRSLYTFYYPGFNFRPTDLQAFLGLRQMKKIDDFADKREKNMLLYDSLIQNDEWKLNVRDKSRKIVNFAYPMLSSKRSVLVKELQDAGVEVRPLVCGSIGHQPFWKVFRDCHISPQSFVYADRVDKQGIYLPNNPDLTKEEICYISDIVNRTVG